MRLVERAVATNIIDSGFWLTLPMDVELEQAEPR